MREAPLLLVALWVQCSSAEWPFLHKVDACLGLGMMNLDFVGGRAWLLLGVGLLVARKRPKIC